MNKTLLRATSAWLAAMVLALPAAAHAAHEAEFSRAELDQMLAPVALYPDTVLTHVLIAATYPDEVYEAARWSGRHPELRGEEAVDAVEDYDWDPSVKALVAFPELLERMDEDREWTETLGDAFLAQEADVMDTVQGLRRRAYEAGHLRSLDHVHVIHDGGLYYIEPAVRHVVYVPYYDPWWVYGSWWWPAYPPHYWAYWGGYPYTHYHRHYHATFYWGTGFHVAPAFYFATFHWPAHRVVVVNHYHAPPVYSGRDVERHRHVSHWQRHDRGEHRGWAQQANREHRGPQETRAHREQRREALRDEERRDGAWRDAGRRVVEPRTEAPERRERHGPRRDDDRRDAAPRAAHQAPERRAERQADRRAERQAERSAGRQAERRDEHPRDERRQGHGRTVERVARPERAPDRPAHSERASRPAQAERRGDHEVAAERSHGRRGEAVRQERAERQDRVERQDRPARRGHRDNDNGRGQERRQGEGRRKSGD